MGTERHPTGGVDVDGGTPLAERVAGSATIDTIRGVTIGGGVVATGLLDPTVQPFLDHHRIDGTAVLPGVMGIESFVTAAGALLPEHHLVCVEDVDFLAPFKFFRDEPREIEVTALLELDGDEVVAHCRLLGTRTLASQPEPQTTLHFSGTIRFGRGDRPALGTVEPPPGGEVEVEAEDVYRIYFHGPAYRVLDEAWAARRDGEVVMCGEWDDDVPPATAPADARLATAPRWLELCFQTAGVWEIATTGQMALPNHIDRVEFAGPEHELDDLVAVAEPHGDHRGTDAVVIDDDGVVLVRMTGYRTIELPGSLDDALVAPLRATTDRVGDASP